MSTPEPWRCGNSRFDIYAANMIVIQPSPVSNSEVSTMPPLPVRPRSCNAARTPITDHIAAPISMMDAVTRTGGRPSSPNRLISPL